MVKNGNIDHSDCLGMLSLGDGLETWSSIVAMVKQFLGLQFELASPSALQLNLFFSLVTLIKKCEPLFCIGYGNGGRG